MFKAHTYRCAKLKHISRVGARGAVMRTWSQKWRTKCRSSACLSLSCCRERKKKSSQKEKHFYLSLKETFSWDFEYFYWKRRKKEQNFEIQNLLNHKIEIILFWHCQNETRWLHFGIFSNGFCSTKYSTRTRENVQDLQFLPNSFACLCFYSATFIPPSSFWFRDHLSQSRA